MKPFHPQVNLFFNALVFFTRIPAPAGVDFSSANLSQASRYLPIIGLLIGAIAAVIWWVTSQLLPQPIAILLSMLSTLLATGAFHEDGLADCADGFGGGWEKPQILTIMKDSRIGAYGAIALIMMLALKFSALSSLTHIITALLLGHSLSRLAAVCLIYKDSYVQDDAQSKVKPVARTIDKQGMLVAALPAILIFILMADIAALLVLIPVTLTTLGCSFYFNKRIGGYTGDCLGSCQQLNELVIYLWFCLPWML
ncbi:adenosylcobinamide-GDP ribazoletransferase [Amphritea balenae]|uniref:Adenosylcobinamide-GDP ribazoletransferase n=1 Tax=Amphritea balenae TaxID=452629 RepID=A0A3P1STZ1_9GAMM|nr:adenosylcobinamide-GDP ribazoletransferase [Amphritea balenae]RRD00621.1 adenosylcobinamide-GDP ribazoletransferase [Amphritea balenae]GGK69244.1 adenosylcobinamide-GDP ribazoletransferase [Amphritea balenae]